MWFFLRMTFWLAVVLVLLPTGGQTAPKSQVSASEAFLAAKGAVTDFEHFCERQQEACVVGSRTAVTLGERWHKAGKAENHKHQSATEAKHSERAPGPRVLLPRDPTSAADLIPAPLPSPDLAAVQQAIRLVQQHKFSEATALAASIKRSGSTEARRVGLSARSREPCRL